MPVSGKVMMGDGSAPPEPVRIEAYCGFRSIVLGYTDTKGGFSTASQVAQFSDARAASGRASRRASRGVQSSTPECTLRAILPGYRSNEINMALMENSPGPLMMVLRPLASVEGRTVSATSLAAPKEARGAFEKAVNAMRKRKWDEARAHLEKAVRSYPRYAAAWADLGAVHRERQELDQAHQAFQEAVAIDPKFINPYFGLAEIAMHRQRWREMAEHTGALLKLDPYDLPGAYAYDAMAHLNLNQLDAAEKSAREGIQIDHSGRVPKNHHLLGVVLMRKGDYETAAGHLRKYLDAAQEDPDAEFVRRQLAACEARLAVRASQAGGTTP